jgi:hypothetical protein
MAMTEPVEQVAAFTVRIPPGLCEATRLYAALTKASLKDVVRLALRHYLTEENTNEAVEALFEEQRAQLHQAVHGLEVD